MYIQNMYTILLSDGEEQIKNPIVKGISSQCLARCSIQQVFTSVICLPLLMRKTHDLCLGIICVCAMSLVSGLTRWNLQKTKTKQ